MTVTATARGAGLLYLVVVLTGIVSLAYVPSQISVPGNAAATVANIRTYEPLFRVGIAAGLVCYTAFLLLPLLLYRLLAPSGRAAAATMVALATASVPIAFGNLVHRLNALSLVGGGDHLAALTPSQIDAQVMIELAAYGNGLLVVKIFWGLWLLPFGYLVVRSGLLPRLLGLLLMAGCLGYLIDVGARLFVPAYGTAAVARLVTLPGSVGEIGTCLWLLIMGVRTPNAAAPQSAS